MILYFPGSGAFMKMKTQEKFRIATLISLFLLSVVTDESASKNGLNEIIKLLDINGISINDLEKLKDLINEIFNLDIITNFYTQTQTKEYRELKSLYDQVIDNTADLSRDLGFNDPVEIFAMYVYLYRKGYLSYNKYFAYGTDMKDFAKLGGIDVVRGSGVCRSISSFLTDLYSSCGFKSTNLSVNASSNSIKNQQNLSNIELNVQQNSRGFVKVISLSTKIIPIANHQITTVIDKDHCYVFDPTNDGYLKKGKYNRIDVPGYSKSNMKITSLEQLFMGIIGASKMQPNLITLYKDLNLTSIDDDEYRTIYLDSLKVIQDNLSLFEYFYYNNERMYKDIYNISEEQNDMIRRILPIIPKVKSKNIRTLR